MTDENTQLSPEDMKAKIRRAIYPLEGPAIHTRTFPAGDPENMGLDGGYQAAAESLAYAMLLTMEDDPSLLDITDEREKDPSGWDEAHNDKLWKATQEKFPDLNRWLGGATGFQYGWAHNAVRYAFNFPPVGNPAVLTVGPKDA